ncbi:hypothetical protein [Streptomyces shenzhenensis]|uniref:hypothetical protein n=1 Tax=Streptomyces shenzhenensis TaxID=943815 RepID=UPI0033F07A11
MNGRKAKQRRRREAEHSARLLAAIRAAVPVLLCTTPDGDEVWQRGPVTMAVPVVPLDAPTELQQAVTAYRMATLTTDCPRCDNDVWVTVSGEYRLRHEGACPADPERLIVLAEGFGVEVRRRS